MYYIKELVDKSEKQRCNLKVNSVLMFAVLGLRLNQQHFLHCIVLTLHFSSPTNILSESLLHCSSIIKRPPFVSDGVKTCQGLEFGMPGPFLPSNIDV